MYRNLFRSPMIVEDKMISAFADICLKSQVTDKAINDFFISISGFVLIPPAASLYL